jgi:hypothetical protein
MRLSTWIRRGGLKELVLRSEESGQLRGWRWGVFHPRGHKDVPLVTLQLRRKGIRRRSYARSVTVCTGGPVGANRDLLSLRPVWALQQRLCEPWTAHKPLAPARVYAIIPGESEGGPEVVTGTVMEIKAPLRRISFKYQLGRLREHGQRSSRMYSMDSFKSYGLKQIHGGPLSMIHSGNKESLP